MTVPNETNALIKEVSSRIRDLREISGYSIKQMSEMAEITAGEYEAYEGGIRDLPFSFIHKCARIFGVEVTDLLEGNSATLSAYTVTRAGGDDITARQEGIEIKSLAQRLRNKIAEPYWVTYDYSEELQNKPIAVTQHSGQEFDLVLSGKLKVQIGNNTEVLSEGDSIYYNSSMPHGMIAVGGENCTFIAVVLPGEKTESYEMASLIHPPKREHPKRVYHNFVDKTEDENGNLLSCKFKNEDRFNFAFDIVDELAQRKPDKICMVHLDKDKNERHFNFYEMSRLSSQTANYFRSLGIERGDKVMLVLKRSYQFWLSILALHKIGAVAIPATDQLMVHDFEYRFQAAGVKAVVCVADSNASEQIDLAQEKCPELTLKLLAGGKRDGWHDFDAEYPKHSPTYARTADAPCGSDTMLMFFTSGTTGYPKITAQNYKYPLGHFITAKYWHCVDPDGIHFTISDTGWGKALWGKLYGQWMCEAATFVYDFERFDANDLLPLFAKYNITTFCAPPTMYRIFIKEDLSKFDLSSIKYATTAGEALNPEVFHQFKKATGLSIMEGFGQTETTLIIGNLIGSTPKLGSMGKPVPTYDVAIMDADGNESPVGETGEICIRTNEYLPAGLFDCYYKDEDRTHEVWHDGLYHTGDTAWRDEDGYYWYVGRTDDVIKSSGYRIGPFEIESVIMELPYVLECGVSAAPDPVRGQVVKASIVLVAGTEGTDELKKEIQEYVKKNTAPYKYPRIVIFREDLPKTISGKIKRNQL